MIILQNRPFPIHLDCNYEIFHLSIQCKLLRGRSNVIGSQIMLSYVQYCLQCISNHFIVELVMKKWVIKELQKESWAQPQISILDTDNWIPYLSQTWKKIVCLARKSIRTCIGEVGIIRLTTVQRLTLMSLYGIKLSLQVHIYKSESQSF